MEREFGRLAQLNEGVIDDAVKQVGVGAGPALQLAFTRMHVIWPGWSLLAATHRRRAVLALLQFRQARCKLEF